MLHYHDYLYGELYNFIALFRILTDTFAYNPRSEAVGGNAGEATDVFRCLFFIDYI